MPVLDVDNEFSLDFDEPAVALDSEGNLLNGKQYAFFKNSKCVDEYGALFVAYHAATKDYDTFDFSRAGSGAGSIFGKGAYFSADIDSVKIYGNKVKEYYLNLKNPFVYVATDTEEDALYNIDSFIEVLKRNNFPMPKDLRLILEEDVIENDGGLDTLIELTCGQDKATAYFKNCGYDGIVNLDVLDFVAYEPNQIKLRSNKAPTSAVSTAA